MTSNRDAHPFAAILQWTSNPKGREQVAAPYRSCRRHLVAVYPVRTFHRDGDVLRHSPWRLRKLQVDETRHDVTVGDRALTVLRLQECLGKVSRRETSQTTSPEGFLRQDGWVRLLGYTRISTASQDAQLQLDALTKAGVEARDVFSDVTSGSKNAVQRPGMRRLLEYATAGDTVVVWRVDRLGRSLIDVLNTVTLLRESGIGIRSIQDGIRSIQDGIDPATTSGRLMLNMLATLAEYERELITERVNAGIAAAKASGTQFGRPRVEPAVIAEKLAIVNDARAKGRTATDAARLVGWSRATFYRHNATAQSQDS